MPAFTRVQRCRRLPRNDAGRDFVVGDLHGHRLLLELELERLAFDPARDRVLSVGDLVDRGPDSLATLALIREPWFHAVLGNHEMMLLHFLQCYESRRYARKSWASGQGAWVADAIARHPRRVERLRDALMALPLALHVDDELPFRVTHADADPRLLREGWWSGRGGVPVHEAEDMTCSRANLASLGRGDTSLLPFDERSVRVSDRLLGAMPLTYVGHSPLAEMTVHNSHVYIDQGVCAAARKGGPPRPPTVVEHRAFAAWLRGVSLARQRPMPVPAAFDALVRGAGRARAGRDGLLAA